MQFLVKKVAKSRSAADVIDSIDDLLIQILLRLPLKSLMRFKLVSKHWKSLITSHHFSLVRYRGSNPVLGLFIQDRMSSYNYISLDATNLTTEPPIRALTFPGDHSPYLINQSCNGLFLCSGFDESEARGCYIYNPTTKCSARLPRPNRIVLGLNLAFDPAKSPAYKVVCVRSSGHSYEPFQIEIYSSESRAWRVSGEPFGVGAWFHHGVYWNGSIHWINYQENDILYFDINKEEIKRTSLPDGMARVGYFGESRDHLHVIGICDEQMGFNVYEMRRDYEGWFVVYRVDMTMAAEYFHYTTNYYCGDVNYRMMSAAASELKNRVRYRYFVLSLVRMDEKRAFLVLHAPDKALRCNLHDNTFEVIPDIGAAVVGSWLQHGFKRFGFAGIGLPYAFELVESLAGV